MGTMRILIVDDERPARQRLRELLAAEEGVEVIGEAADGIDAVERIERDEPDVVLLDVEMPELDGFGVLAALPDERLPLVIFVTAFSHYAVRAFDAQAIDYVTKPVSRERLAAAIERARQRLNTGLRSSDDLVRLAREQQRRPAARLAVRTGARTRIIQVSAIDWAEAAGNYVELFAGSERFLVRSSMNEIEEKLPREKFARIHRSVIVNVDRIVELRPAANRGDAIVVMKGGKELPLSRSFRDRIAGMFAEL
jgi:two-component system, LytTR family, response regulator